MNPQIMPVSFHGDTLVIVAQGNEPFVAMKSVVESMGLAWQVQHRKLTDRFEATVMEIITVAEDGKPRPMTCLPLRKLPAWLYSISPNKVKPELRDKIIRYQEECDDALWDYWTKGITSRVGANNVHQKIAMSRHRVTLLKELHKSRDNTLRAALHEQLAMVSQQLGLSVPALETIGKGTPDTPEIAKVFWSALEQLDSLGARYNHSGTMSGTIALNYPQLEKLFKQHRIAIHITQELRHALKLSQHPRFIEYKVKQSWIEDKSVRCWIFEGPIR